MILTTRYSADPKQSPRRPDLRIRSYQEPAVQLAISASADAEQVLSHPARCFEDCGPAYMPV